MHEKSQPDAPAPTTSVMSVFLIFLRLGLTSFGGPIAHFGFFRTEFVERRQWLQAQAYADLVALCQFLPGPASSQVGIGLGYLRCGWWGAIAAWAGFTLPSALALAAVGLLVARFGAGVDAGWLHGLKLVTVAVVAQALWGMGTSLCADRQRASVAVGALALAVWMPGLAGQLAAIGVGALVGWRCLRTASALPHSPFPVGLRKRAGVALLAVFAALLVVLPIVAAQSASHGLELFSRFFRAGSLVFGGGHVVLPVLQAAVVQPGWVSSGQFLAGYGLAQAVPGPLFTFAAYLGAVAGLAPAGWLGAAIALAGIFLPAFLLVIGALPLWERARQFPGMQRAMLGINAAVVGLLLAAFYDPVWTGAIHSARDFGVAVAAFLALVFWRVPPWLAVLACAVAMGVGGP